MSDQTDIVAHLRQCAELMPVDELTEAADEIEALREVVAQVCDMYTTVPGASTDWLVEQMANEYELTDRQAEAVRQAVKP